MKLWNKMRLRDRLNHGNYVSIAVWNDGKWAEVGNNFDADLDDDKPIYFITRHHYGEMTHKEIKECFRRLETMILGE